jgi:hypothetical protein
VLRRLSEASWWDWDGGLRPIHWKWQVWYQPIIQHGLPIRFREVPKQWCRPQVGGSTKEAHGRMAEKLRKICKRRYVEPGEVFLLTSFFAVPKGVDSIRMVLEIGSQYLEFPHLVVPLLGRLKGEMGERYHMMILARETASGFQPS